MKLHNENERLTDADRAILKAIIAFGPISNATIRRIVGPCNPQVSTKRLQKCGYLEPRQKGDKGYRPTCSGKQYASF